MPLKKKGLTEMVSCIVCGCNDFSPLYPEIHVVKCTCGHVYFNRVLNEVDLKQLYTQEYYTGSEYMDYERERDALQKNFKKRLKIIRKYVPGGKLLEIGSAYGYFLSLASKHFTTLGFEISPEASHYAREHFGLDVRCQDFIQAPIEGKYDVACLFDCIEHLIRPDLYLEKIRSLLNDGGYLFLTTGDICSLLPRLRGKKWRLMHPPTHIHFFSRKSISRLAQNHMLIPCSITYPGMWRSTFSITKKALNLKVSTRLLPSSLWMNTFDIMEVICRKNSD